MRLLERTLPWYSATARSVAAGCLDPSPAEMVEAPYGAPPWTASRPEMAWLEYPVSQPKIHAPERHCSPMGT